MPKLICDFTGIVNCDTEARAFTGKPTLNTRATQKSPVEKYAISVAVGTLKSADYGFKFEGSELTITKAPLTFAAVSFSVPFDKPIPPLTYTLNGFFDGVTAKVLSGKPAETTQAKEGSPPKTYPITIKQGSLKAPNYSFLFNDGRLTITPK